MDDYSSYAEVICVKRKVGVAAVVIERLTGWERQTEHKLKVQCTDHGMGYTGALGHECRQDAVVRQLSAPRTLKQNGRAAMLNRALHECMRAMLLDGKMLLCFWTFGLDTVVYTRNIVAVKGQDMTPLHGCGGCDQTCLICGCSAARRRCLCRRSYDTGWTQSARRSSLLAMRGTLMRTGCCST